MKIMNQRLINNLDYRNNHPEYIPHMTIAYVKPGLGKTYYKKLKYKYKITPKDYVYYNRDDGKYRVIQK